MVTNPVNELLSSIPSGVILSAGSCLYDLSPKVYVKEISHLSVWHISLSAKMQEICLFFQC